MGENQKIKLSKKQITTIVSIITLFLGGETFVGAKLIESKIQDFNLVLTFVSSRAATPQPHEVCVEVARLDAPASRPASASPALRAAQRTTAGTGDDCCGFYT